MKDNILQIKCNITKQKWYEFIKTEAFTVVSQEMSIQGMKVFITLDNSLPWEMHSYGKTIHLHLPLQIKFLKSEGLFGLEGEGSIKLFLDSTIDIDKNLTLSSRTNLSKYEWINGPVIHMGALDIPAQSLSNLIISYFKDRIINEIDKKIESQITLKKWIVEAFSAYGINKVISTSPTLYLNTQIHTLTASDFKDDGAIIKMDLAAELFTKISDIPIVLDMQSDPTFSWQVEEMPQSEIKIEMEISYSEISSLLTEQVSKIEIANKKIVTDGFLIRKISNNNLEVKTNIHEPIKGILTITVIPRLNKTDQSLELEVATINLDAENIIYKLSSPVIEKLIKSKIESQFPIQISKILKTHTNTLPKLNILHDLIEITPIIEGYNLNDILLQESGIIGSVTLQNATINIVA